MGKWRQALECFEAVAASGWSASQLHYEAGRALYGLRRDHEAVERFEEALQQRPSAGTWRGLGRSLYRLGDWHGACDAYERAAHQGSRDPKLHLEWSRALAKADALAAVRAHKEAIKLDPRDAELHHGLGRLLASHGNHYGAARAFWAAVSRDASRAAWHRDLGAQLRRVRRDELAEAAVQALLTAVELVPDAAEYHYELGLAYEACPGEEVVLDSLAGLTKRKVGLADAAIAAYCSAIALDDRVAEYHLRLGRVHERLMDFPAAVAAYRSAVKLEPENQSALLRLGIACQQEQVGAYDEAMRSYAAVVRLQGDRSQAARRRLTRLAARTQRWDEACLAARLDGSLPAAGQQRTDRPRSAEEMSLEALQSLFANDTPTLGAEQAAEYMRTLRAGSVHTHADWWQLLHLRMLSLGWFSLGFEAKELYAELIAAESRQHRGRRLGEALQHAQALVYLQREQEAIDVLSSLQGRLKSRRDKLTLRKLIADVQLWSGETEPLLAAMDEWRTREPWPLDARFAQLVKGRTVAIVGPADSHVRQGDEIDAHDVVIRTKFIAEGSDDRSPVLGKRTDISYYAVRDMRLLDEEVVRAVAQGHLRMAVGRPYAYRPRDAARYEAANIRFYRADLRSHFRATPLGIQRMIYDLLQFRPARIDVYNVDFFSRQQKFRQGYRRELRSDRDGSYILNDVFAVHDLRSDFLLSQVLAKAGHVFFDQESSAILDQPLTDYLATLDRNGPF